MKGNRARRSSRGSPGAWTLNNSRISAGAAIIFPSPIGLRERAARHAQKEWKEIIDVRTTSACSLLRFFTVVLPQVSRELSRWQRCAASADWPLSQQARSGFTEERFRTQKGSFYALYNFNPLHEKKLVKLIVALQTLGDYLGNLCACGGVYNEAAFRFLYQALPAALSDGPARERDYYRFYPAKRDGGYLEALVRECRSCIGDLPGYPGVQREVLRLASLHNDLQVYRHLHPLMGSSRLKRWFREKATPVRPSLHWWEYAAACASNLSFFALFGLATSFQSDGRKSRELAGAYFPWICGFHILLESWVFQGNDGRKGALNFTSCYRSPALAAERLSLFLRIALQKVSALPHPSFHRSVIQGLLALYLSDPKVEHPGRQEIASGLIRAGGRGARRLHRLCRFLRPLGALGEPNCRG